MARARRIQEPGLIRHVMSRGNGRMTIFLDDADYRKFIHLLGDVTEALGIECLNFCAMPNHYHLTLKPSRPNLSKAIRWLNGTYGSWWNKRHDRVGHVFQGRFKDQIVQHEGYFPALSRYVAMNPVRANLVERPELWPWSSYRAIVGMSPCPPFLSVRATLMLFGDEEDSVLRCRFAEFVMSAPEPSSIDRIRSNERILGDRGFKTSVVLAHEGQVSAAIVPSMAGSLLDL
jgi:putative transposase